MVGMIYETSTIINQLQGKVKHIKLLHLAEVLLSEFDGCPYTSSNMNFQHLIIEHLRQPKLNMKGGSQLHPQTKHKI